MTQATTALARDELFVAELHRLGVDHLARLSTAALSAPVPPVDLIVGLAASDDSRLQAALILLFLRRPSFNQYLPDALPQLSSASATALKLYYQAAVYLQNELEAELKTVLEDWQPLPDCFCAELGLPPSGSSPTDDALRALGARHRELSGWAYNWAGSYRQNIPRFLKHLKRAYGHHRP